MDTLPLERRAHLRLDKLCTVYLSTEDGLMRGLARNITSRGMFIEVCEAMGLGEKMKVTFAGEDGTEVTFLCEVRYQVDLTGGRKEGWPAGHYGLGLRIITCDAPHAGPKPTRQVMH